MSYARQPAILNELPPLQKRHYWGGVDTANTPLNTNDNIDMALIKRAVELLMIYSIQIEYDYRLLTKADKEEIFANPAEYKEILPLILRLFAAIRTLYGYKASAKSWWNRKQAIRGPLKGQSPQEFLENPTIKKIRILTATLEGKLI